MKTMTCIKQILVSHGGKKKGPSKQFQTHSIFPPPTISFLSNMESQDHIQETSEFLTPLQPFPSLSKKSILGCVCAQSCLTLCQPTRFLCLWNVPGKNPGVDCYFLFRGIFPIQGSNLCLLHLLHCHIGSLPLALFAVTLRNQSEKQAFSGMEICQDSHLHLSN